MTRWWRCYEGAPFDPKWRVIAAKVNGRPGDVWAIASAILDFSSSHGGSLIGIDYEEIAVGLGYETRFVTDVTVSLVSKRFMKHDVILGWAEKQFSPPSTARVRAFRERQKSNKNKREKRGNESETVSRNAETHETPQIQNQIQIEEDDHQMTRARENPPPLLRSQAEPPPHIAVAKQVLSILTISLDDPKWFGTIARVQMWMARGWDPEALIIPAARRMMARRGSQGPPGTIDYVEKAIQSYAAELARPLPEPSHVNGQHPPRPAAAQTGVRRNRTKEEDQAAIVRVLGLAAGMVEPGEGVAGGIIIENGPG